MGQRLDLHQILVDLLGSSNVYFQPPDGIRMEYPAITYQRDAKRTEFANNNPYKGMTRYSVTVIDSNPDSVIPDAVGALPMCVFDRHFTNDQLNHDSYTLYF